MIQPTNIADVILNSKYKYEIYVKNLEISVNRNSLLAMAPMLNFRLAQMIQSLFTTTQ
jgi:hypothetical protein